MRCVHGRFLNRQCADCHRIENGPNFHEQPPRHEQPAPPDILDQPLTGRQLAAVLYNAFGSRRYTSGGMEALVRETLVQEQVP